MTEHLWHRALSQFEYHQQSTDATPLAALNRIATKCLRLPEPARFHPENCTITEIWLSRHDLSRTVRFHERTAGYPTTEPPVAIATQGRLVLIEGNTRVNRWLQEGREGPFHMLVLSQNAA